MTKRIQAGLAIIAVISALNFAALLISHAPSLFASQGNLYLPTTGTYNSLQAVGYMNDAWDALLTCNKGNAAPANALGGVPKAGQCWLDDTSATLLVKKRYTGSAWVVEGVIDVTNGMWVPPVGGGTANVASATTTDLCASPQAVQNVTGTTTITGFGSSCLPGTRKTLIFAGIATITYNATSMLIPGSLNYDTAAGDVIEAVYFGSGNWRVTNITKVNGAAIVNPAVDVGTIQWYAGASAPTKYVFGYGQSLARASYPDYVTAVTRVQSAVRTSGNPTLGTISDTSGMGVGMPIEGTGIQAGTTIVSVTSSSITMSQNAASSGTANATVFFTGYGAGGSSTTVGVPDCRGRTLAGRDDMGGTAASRLTSSYFGASAAALNTAGTSSESYTMLLANLASHNHAVFLNDPGHAHSYTTPVVLNGMQPSGSSGQASAAGSTTSTNTTGITVRDTAGGAGTANQTASTGSATPMPTVQPTLIAQCLIRVLAMNEIPLDGQANDNIAVAIAPRRFA